MNTADNELSFNDLPKAVTRILSDVGDIKQMLHEMHHRQEKTKPADRHVPMTVDEAAEYLTLPKNTLMTNSPRVRFRRPSPASDMCSIRTSLTDGWSATARLPCR